MNRPAFTHSIVVAVLLAASASIGSVVFPTFLSFDSTCRLLISLLAVGYTSFLFRYAGTSTGRITSVALLLALPSASALANTQITTLLLGELVTIWLIRSTYFHKSPLPALLDLVVIGTGLSMGYWSLNNTGSVFITVWCFFLSQSLFVFIPARNHRFHKPVTNDSVTNYSEKLFNQAHHQADAATRQLFARRP